MTLYKISKSEYPFINHEEAASFYHMKDMKCVRKTYTKLQMRNKKAQSNALKVLGKHMKSSLGPGWFQELSMYQIAAANLLFTAVQIDGIHCQLKRVIPVLNRINIHPLPEHHQLAAALKFAQGSDLAFLWFLYNRVYRTSNDVCTQQRYTLNERLILSCICHLDMLLTLRELERILPKVERKEKKIKIEKPKVKNEKKIYESPYDEPLPRSKLPIKEIIKRPSRPQPKFEIYEMYKDPYYIIENEVNRWFAESSLMPTDGECITQKIILDKVDEAVQDLKNNSINLCKKHKDESSQFYKMMKRILNETDETLNDEEFSHLNSFERGIVQGVRLELLKAEKEAQNREEEKNKQIIVKTVLRQIIDSAADLRYIHLCEKCEECLKSRQIFDEIIEEKELVEKSSETSIASSIIQYCHRPTPYGPLTFDYEKIFATSFLVDQDAVRNSINTALEVEKHLTEDNAITVCLRDMWQLELKLWNEKQRTDVLDRQWQVIGEAEEVWGNKKKILKLLEDAIAVLRRNPKFVLAALPDSHRIPMLREWILQKYGVKHTDEEEREKYKINKVQREVLISTGIVPRIKVPTYQGFGIKKPVMCYDEIIKKKNKREKWLKKFETKLATGCVERCRLYYATTEPYLTNFETNRLMFYAYLPGVHKDIDQHVMNENIF